MSNAGSKPKEILSLLRNPDTGNPLVSENGSLKDTLSGERFLVRDRIPVIMLRKCRKNLKNWGLDAGLVQGNAEALPFGNGIFDVVFHVGGFNFFNDKKKAVDEMIRVAKPGANLYIVDETDSIRENRGLIAGIISRFLPSPEVFTPPVKHISEEMLEVREHMLLDRKFWMVSFQKPATPL